MQLTVFKPAPEGLRRTAGVRATGGLEEHMTEGAVMVAFAMHLFENGAREVRISPDGQHNKQGAIRDRLEAFGFTQQDRRGKTDWAGTYTRGDQMLVVDPKSGQFDVFADGIRAECKGGIINSSAPGPRTRLRRGFCEIIGSLILSGGNVAVAPDTPNIRTWAAKVPAGIRVALIARDGTVTWMITEKRPAVHSDTAGEDLR